MKCRYGNCRQEAQVMKEGKPLCGKHAEIYFGPEDPIVDERESFEFNRCSFCDAQILEGECEC